MIKQINEQAKAERVDPLKLKNCHASSVVADTVTLGLHEGVRSYALDPERAKALWKQSEELVAESF